MRGGAVLALLFACLVGLRIHGYSIPVWRTMIDGSRPTEVLLGQPRQIRGDDFIAELPLALAQTAHDPPFPVVNTDIGTGQNMLLPFSLPVAHVLTLFRPTSWGFFLGQDAGLAWMWWSRLLGLLVACFAAFRSIAPGRDDLAALASLVLVASPFFQFWSFRYAPVVMFGAFCFVAAYGIATGGRRLGIALSGLLLGWAGAGFALELYPPFQIPVGIVLLLVGAAVLWDRRRRLDGRSLLAWRVAAAFLGLAIPLAAIAILLADAGDAIDLMRNTAYPGSRIATGGGRTVFELVAANLLVPPRVEDWDPLGNICEAAGFFVIAPPLLAAALWRRVSGASRGSAIELAVAVCLLVLGWHAVVGVPEWLARVTPLRLVPGERAVIGMGLAEGILLVHWLSRSGAGLPHTPALLIALPWAACLALAALRLSRVLPEVGVGVGVLFALLNGGVVWLALARRRPRTVLAAVLAISLAGSAWFNPVVRGGTDFLYENRLAREIERIDAESGGESVWLVWGRPRVAMLFRMLGVRALNGLHPVPDPGLWRVLDPAGRFDEVYNRYAFVAFLPGAGARPRMEVKEPMLAMVRIHPGSPRLRRLGVTHMLARDVDPGDFARASGYAHVASVGAFHLFAAGAD